MEKTTKRHRKCALHVHGCYLLSVFTFWMCLISFQYRHMSDRQNKELLNVTASADWVLV